ncbi:hypothetical protein HH213_18020 [Duganella dendranthematis]|uniref:Lipoprotein n=1 Tax=Duganella dendranthematis TaxID=2728021 RepID=A0ABX6MC73_9BURK|nr:hypothetical protein [Duganella dendranthematis]QJD91820.1 hypothetical protein HH213_18020 [Duganella dendranthematis]
MSHKEKVILHVLLGFVGYAVWAMMAFFDPSLRHDFLVFNIGMATGTIGLALRDMKTASDASAAAQTPLPPPDPVERTMIVCGRTSSVPQAPPPRPAAAEAGFARVSVMAALAMSMLVVLSACSLVPQNVSAVQEGVAQTVVQSSERTICRDIPIGTWLRLYGANADRLKGWQALCFNPVTAPLNAETIAAILKLYPGFVAASTATPPPVTPDTLPGVAAAVQSGAAVPANGEVAK